METAFRLVELFPLQDVLLESQKKAMRESIQKSVRGFLEAIPDIGRQKSEEGVLLNLDKTQAEANLAENKIMKTLSKRLKDLDQEREIRNIALGFNKRIIDDNEKSPYLKAFLEQARYLMSHAANDSTLTMQRTRIQTEPLSAVQRLAQEIDSEKKITFTPVGMTEMIKALKSFNDQYAREHNLKLGDGKY